MQNYNYDSFDSWKWTSYDGKKKLTIEEFLGELDGSEEIYIGTDSQNYSKGHKHCKFTSVIILYKRGLGGKILTHLSKTDYMGNLRERLLMEAMRSLECAWYVQKIIPEKTPMYIHLDVNENLKYKSSKYKDELVGLIAAQGFNALWKPNSWAPSSVADSRC